MVIAKMTIGGAITQNCVQNGIVFPPFRSSSKYSEKDYKKQQKNPTLKIHYMVMFEFVCKLDFTI